MCFLEKARTEKKAVEAVKKILRQEHSPEAMWGRVAGFLGAGDEGRKAGRVKPCLFRFAVGSPVSYTIEYPLDSTRLRVLFSHSTVVPIWAIQTLPFAKCG